MIEETSKCYDKDDITRQIEICDRNWFASEERTHIRTNKENSRRKLVLKILVYRIDLPDELCNIVLDYTDPNIVCIDKLDYQFDTIYNNMQTKSNHICSKCCVKIYKILYRKILRERSLIWYNWRLKKFNRHKLLCKDIPDFI